MTSRDIIIKGGRVIDPAHDHDGAADIRISGGTVAEVGTDLDTDGGQVVDAAGKLVMPGLIDMHVHLREPGFEESETIMTGCDAAAAGGFTAVCCMPNTNPAIDDAAHVQFIRNRAEGARARVYPIGAITRGRKGAEITEMADMARAGAVAFSDDGSGIESSRIMLNALRYAAMVGRPLLLHEEDEAFSPNAHMNESALSARLGLGGLPRVAEEIPTMRDIALAEYVGAPIHITHISTRVSVELVRAAKARGQKVTCDVTPHHLTLTEELVATFDTRYKMKPPLRTADDIAALVEGLKDGTIDAIATDHAPHAPEIKDVEFTEAANGVTGLETALGVMHREFVAKDVLSWTDVIRLMSMNPAAILGVDGGGITPGSPADITIYDPANPWVVDPAAMKSKSGNSAYFDWELPGTVVMTMVGGVVYENG